MRIRHVRTLQHYLQDMAAEHVLGHLPERARSSVRVAPLAAFFFSCLPCDHCRGPVKGLGACLHGEHLLVPRSGLLTSGGGELYVMTTLEALKVFFYDFAVALLRLLRLRRSSSSSGTRPSTLSSLPSLLVLQPKPFGKPKLTSGLRSEKEWDRPLAYCANMRKTCLLSKPGRSFWALPPALGCFLLFGAGGELSRLRYDDLGGPEGLLLRLRGGSSSASTSSTQFLIFGYTILHFVVTSSRNLSANQSSPAGCAVKKSGTNLWRKAPTCVGIPELRSGQDPLALQVCS